MDKLAKSSPSKGENSVGSTTTVGTISRLIYEDNLVRIWRREDGTEIIEGKPIRIPFWWGKNVQEKR